MALLRLPSASANPFWYVLSVKASVRNCDAKAVVTSAPGTYAPAPMPPVCTCPTDESTRPEISVFGATVRHVSTSACTFPDDRALGELPSHLLTFTPPDASDDELKKAYREMAKKHHPDMVAQLGDDIKRSATEKFQKISAAYEEIKKQRGMV